MNARRRTPGQVPGWQALAMAAAMAGLLAFLIVLLYATAGSSR